MYDYRRMTSEERKTVVAERMAGGVPWHAPPHFGSEQDTYLVSAACFDHREVLTSASRLSEFVDALVAGLQETVNTALHAWVVQPNHYHLLLETDLDMLRRRLGRLHNGKSMQWNREDGTAGRKVWYRFSDRRVRSERHYYATVNYIHDNPVKHGYADDATDWPWSSLNEYIETFGAETLADWRRRYPVRDYGKGWDD